MRLDDQCWSPMGLLVAALLHYYSGRPTTGTIPCRPENVQLAMVAVRVRRRSN